MIGNSSFKRMLLITPLLVVVSACCNAQVHKPWLKHYHPTAKSKKYAPGSAAERRARMAYIANHPQYSKKFDLSQLPDYKPIHHPKGVLRICGDNYIGDSPLGKWWKNAFHKYQPDIKIEYNLQTAADAIPCLYFNKANIGINHEPSFYDFLGFIRLKGYLPTGISAFTGSYNVIGWQNNIAIIVNKQNPINKMTMKQLDDIFGSQRAGGWVKTTWHPEFARSSADDIRTWGQLGLKGKWASAPIHTYGYSLRYATALIFSNKVLKSSDKWNGNLLAFGNYRRSNGTTYLEADEVMDHVKADPNGIGYIRYHNGVKSEVKVLNLAKTDSGPYVKYSINSVYNRSYPLWGDQSFWVGVKPGTKIAPKIDEFIRFVLSRQGQEFVEKDGKYLPLSPRADAKQQAKLAALERGEKVPGR